MQTLSDHLHDRTDLREELVAKAEAVVRKVLSERFAEALDKTDKLEDALTLIAAWLAEEMDALTTEAVRSGARLRMKRKRKAAGRG